MLPNKSVKSTGLARGDLPSLMPPLLWWCQQARHARNVYSSVQSAVCSSCQVGFAGSRLLEVALLEHRSQALAQSAGGNKNQCGSGRFAPCASIQAQVSIPVEQGWPPRHKSLPLPPSTSKGSNGAGVCPVIVRSGAALLTFAGAQSGFLQWKQAGYLRDLAIGFWAFHHPSSYPDIN